VERELVEPPELAVGSIARALDAVITDPGRHAAWLLVFADLLDKASLAPPRPEQLYLLHAAAASAPTQPQRDVARREVRHFETRLRSQLKDGQPLPRHRKEGRLEVLILVPKPVERRALDAVFDIGGVTPQPFDSRVRYRRFPIEGQRITVTAVCMQEAGNLSAANVVRDYVGAVGRPDLAVLIGMAMATSADVDIGDVVVAEQVIDYEPRRMTPDGGVSRFRAFHTKRSPEADAKHASDVRRRSFLDRIDESRRQLIRVGEIEPEVEACVPNEPMIRFGVILSGEKLVEDSGESSLAPEHDRAYALEMEGAGFATTCHHLDCEWLVVRGVADRGEPNRTKEAQLLATVSAASFVRVLLETEWPVRRTALTM
jgi:adenosylhomocysteine nucleosidase